jgi:hypothetical protein
MAARWQMRKSPARRWRPGRRWCLHAMGEGIHRVPPDRKAAVGERDAQHQSRGRIWAAAGVRRPGNWRSPSRGGRVTAGRSYLDLDLTVASRTPAETSLGDVASGLTRQLTVAAVADIQAVIVRLGIAAWAGRPPGPLESVFGLVAESSVWDDDAVYLLADHLDSSRILC